MARRAMSLLPRWSSRVFAVELDGAPLYFSLREKRPEEDAPRLFTTVRPSCGRCYSLLVCSGDRIRGARFHAELRDKLTSALPPGCDVSPMSSFLPNVKDSLVKGYFFQDYSESPFASERLLRDLTRHDPVLVCSYLRGVDGQVWTQHLWSDTDGRALETPHEYYVVHSDAPEEHPSALGIINSDVFYSFEEAREVMNQVLIIRTIMFYTSTETMTVQKCSIILLYLQNMAKLRHHVAEERYGNVHQAVHSSPLL